MNHAAGGGGRGRHANHLRRRPEPTPSRFAKAFGFSDASAEPLTAETFRYSIERALSPRLAEGTPGTLFVDDIVGEDAFRDGDAQHISGLVANGDRLTITLVAPRGDLVSRLRCPSSVLSDLAHPLFPAGPTTMSPEPTASPIRSTPPAPTTYADWINGEYIILKKNPNYAGQRAGAFDAIAPARRPQRWRCRGWRGFREVGRRHRHRGSDLRAARRARHPVGSQTATPLTKASSASSWCRTAESGWRGSMRRGSRSPTRGCGGRSRWRSIAGPSPMREARPSCSSFPGIGSLGRPCSPRPRPPTTTCNRTWRGRGSSWATDPSPAAPRHASLLQRMPGWGRADCARPGGDRRAG